MKYTIFQVDRQKDPKRLVIFADLEWIKECNIKLTLDYYTSVYEGETNVSEDVMETLEELFERFNRRHPLDYKGRSMSTSDIVKLGERYYFCDSFGWEEVNL